MGGLSGEEKWRPDRTSALEGWLEGGRGSHTWRDPRGLRSRGNALSISPAQLAWLSGRSYTLRGPLQAVLLLGARREVEGEQERQAGGALQDRRSRRGAESVCPSHSDQEACCALRPGPPPSETRGTARTPSVEPKLHTPPRAFSSPVGRKLGPA